MIGHTLPTRSECSPSQAIHHAPTAPLHAHFAAQHASHGMFFMLPSTRLPPNVLAGMNAAMCDLLTEQNSIFLTRDGRISVAGLNVGNVATVAEAIHQVTDGKPLGSP